MKTKTAGKQEVDRNTVLAADFNLFLQAYDRPTTHQNKHTENFNNIIILQLTDTPQTLQHERYIPSFHGKFNISFHGKFTKPVLYKEHRSFPNIYTNT